MSADVQNFLNHRSATKWHDYDYLNLAQNPNNTAHNLSDFMTHAVAYFSFGSENPDETEHLQSRGNNVFGFEDLPGNLGISDKDFNDAVFKFNFIA